VTASGVLYSAFVIVALAVIWLGLMYLRKWAALVFSALTVYVAFWAFKDARAQVRFLESGLGLVTSSDCYW
jgi:hypothetical protein